MSSTPFQMSAGLAEIEARGHPDIWSGSQLENVLPHLEVCPSRDSRDTEFCLGELEQFP